MSLPRDLLLHLFGYAALHSTPSLARTCKAVLAHTRTRAYWRWAVHKRLRERLAGKIDEKRLGMIDVFYGLPDDKCWPKTCGRLRWLFPHGVSPFALTTNVYGKHNVLEVWVWHSCEVLYQWNPLDYYDFGVSISPYHSQRPGPLVMHLLLHPTVRVRRSWVGIRNSEEYDIVDEKRQRFWRGRARYAWDAALGHGVMVPLEGQRGAGAWHPLDELKM